MRIITRTIYGSALQTSLLLGLDYVPEANSTLNEKFDIQADLTFNPGDVPKVGFYCIGNGGHRVISGADGIPYTSPVNHRASDAGLFNHIPFVMRELNNDLSVEERDKYALRKIITVDTVDYIAYYLKRMDLTNVVQNLQHTTVTAGTQSTTPFVPNNGNLSPLQPELPNTGVITTNGDFLTSSAIMNVDFNEKDVEELVNVSLILYGTEDRAVISEVGLCSGVDRVVNVATSLGNTNIRETLGVQIATHITGYYPVGYTNKGFNLQIEAGATEPLLGEGV